MKTIQSQSGTKIKAPEKFSEAFDRSLNIRRYGIDNLYPYYLRDFYETSPSFNSCASRMRNFLYGEGSNSKLISNAILSSILTDLSIFGGFSLFVQYDGLGDIAGVTYIPFESIRLGEQGMDGLYTYCYYNPDWSLNATVNKKKVTKQDSIKYWMFCDNIDVRLQRMNQPEYTGGEVLYYSNSISYPTEAVRAVINLVSAEIGISNVLYRDVRTSFMQNSVLAIPRQSDSDSDDFTSKLQQLQGDENSYKILTVEFSSQEDKPEVLNLNSNDYTDRVLKVSAQCRDAIARAYGQEAFLRLSDGSLGFSGNAIADIYLFYNFQLRTQRKEVETFLKQIDPAFELKEINYPYRKDE